MFWHPWLSGDLWLRREIIELHLLQCLPQQISRVTMAMTTMPKPIPTYGKCRPMMSFDPSMTPLCPFCRLLPSLIRPSTRYTSSTPIHPDMKVFQQSRLLCSRGLSLGLNSLFDWLSFKASSFLKKCANVALCSSIVELAIGLKNLLFLWKILWLKLENCD